MMNLIAQNFAGYELLDSASGKKLERISGILVERPSPQAIWSKKLVAPLWEKAESRVIRKKDGGGVWEHKLGDPSPLSLNWKSDLGTDFTFKLKFTSFGHCGIFFEQTPIWNSIERRVKGKRDFKFLNLFGYTGAASIVAAKAGALVTHIDSAKGVLSWGEENQALNDIKPEKIKWFHSDVMRFLENAIKRGELYDGVLADPPSWGHGARKEVWEFENQIGELVVAISKILKPKDSFFILTSHTHGVQQEALKNLLFESLSKANVTCGEIGVVHKNDARILPAGIYAEALI